MTSHSDRWTEIREAFAEVSEASASERGARLEVLAPDIRAEVQSLLEASLSSDVLKLPVSSASSAPGDIGAYRLLEEIGRGGMGIVYRAERGDGEYRREVAIKIAGGRLFGPEAERRFIQERQILAQLEHPNIVRLLDGGVNDGQRYLVMDLAEGEPITTYVRTKTLSRHVRLTLFRDVCAAIQYAHQRLILHRDLKPGNIIVTAGGTVKVLDFGIAQLIEDAVTSDTTLHPFSPACASPEQVRGERLSLASDVYALGVLLYELIADVNPQYRRDAPFDEVRRSIIEGTPAPPTQLAKPVARDLDAIVSKAIAKDPGDRYASVAELDADVERFMTGRPVLAVPPRPMYVAARFLRRHRALSGTAAALLVSLVVGAGIYVRQSRIEKRRFEDARRLVHSVIFDIQPKLDGVAAALPLRKTLIEETMKYLESVSKDVGADVDLLHELSNAYRELARVQGDLTTSSLGAQAPAVERYARADALMQRALAVAPSDPGLLKDAALLYSRLAGFDSTQNQPDVAFAHATQAAEYAERNVQARGGEFDAREVLAGTTMYLAITAPIAEWDARVSLFKKAGDLFSNLAAERPQKEALRRNRTTILRYLASLHSDKGRLVEAIDFGRQALASSESILKSRPADTALQLDAAIDAGQLAMYLDSHGDFGDAATAFNRALALEEALVKSDASNARAALFLADAARGYARNRLNAGDRAAARLQITRALQAFDDLQKDGKLPAGTQWRVASATVVLADIDQADGRAAPSCANYQRAAKLFDDFERQAPLEDAMKKESEAAHRIAAACGS